MVWQESGQRCHGALQCHNGINKIPSTGNMSYRVLELIESMDRSYSMEEKQRQRFTMLVIYIKLEIAQCL